MTPQEIRDGINADPALLALAQAGDTQGIADALSAGRTTRDAVTKFSSLGISERFPALGGLPGPLAAELVFQKLEGFAAAAQASTDPATKLLGGATARQMGHLKAGGMAIGSPAVGAMLGVIVGAGALSQAEADALVSVADVPATVSAVDVEAALAPPPPTTWTGAITNTELRNGMVHVTITYTSSAGPTKLETPFGDDLTPERVKAIIARRVASLQAADAALALYAQG